MDEYFFHLIVFGVLLALFWMDWSETKFQREKYLIRCTRIDPKKLMGPTGKPRHGITTLSRRPNSIYPPKPRWRNR